MPVSPTAARRTAAWSPTRSATRALPRPMRPRAKSCICPNEPLKLACDQLLAPISIAYETYGALNADKSNAILICHALTMDQYVASEHPVTKKPGWWEAMVGPGKPIDTDRFFVICPNILGGCMGSTGPASIDPKTGKPYGLNFPVITISDMVNAQERLIDHLGIDQLFCVIGGSMGGMQVLDWASSHTQRVFSAVPIATAAWHSSQNIAFHEVGRQAVMADPDWCGGDYHAHGKVPKQRARGRAHGSTHHVPVGGRAAPQVRPQPAGPRQAHVLVQRRFSGGELPAPPGLHLRRPLRRQQLSLHHARDGLLRSSAPSTATCSPMPSAAPRRASASFPSPSRLALPHAREPRDRAGPERGRRQRFVRGDRIEQRPRRLSSGGAGVLRHHSWLS